LQFDKFNGGAFVAVVEGARLEAISPESALEAASLVVVLGVAVMGSADGFGEGVMLAGDDDQVDAVAQEAVGEYIQIVLVGVLAE